MARSITPEQSIVISSASISRQRAHMPGASRLTRRRVAGWAAVAGAAGLLFPTRALAGTEYEGEVPKDAGDDPANSTEYTGPLHGHVVTWDPDVWVYSSSASPDLDYTYDYINLSSLDTGGLAQVQHQEVVFDDIDQVAEEGFDQYLGIYGMVRSDAELMEEWVSEDASGTLFYWLGYDDIPYTYVEFSATDDADVWSLTYVQIRASSWDAGDMANMLESIWTDDDLTIYATDIDDIVDAIDADAN